MAKRKRLTPPRPDFFSASYSEDATIPSVQNAPGRVPIAQVAGDAALTAAFEKVQEELQAAQREGRMILSLPLDAIQENHLIRDRLVCAEEEMAGLKESLRSRGQQTPIEVMDLGRDKYGLISGWRRLNALKELLKETGETERFGTVQALLRVPQDRSAAYVAMVEENEVRADLSFYERARIVVQAVGSGVFDTEKLALQRLFASASFSRRSKIKSFIPLVERLDGVLRYPSQIPERLGLALSKAIAEDQIFFRDIYHGLSRKAYISAEDERAFLEEMLAKQIRVKDAKLKPKVSKPKDRDDIEPVRFMMTSPVEIAQDIQLTVGQGQAVLSGPGVTPELLQELTDWIKTRT